MRVPVEEVREWNLSRLRRYTSQIQVEMLQFEVLQSRDGLVDQAVEYSRHLGVASGRQRKRN